MRTRSKLKNTDNDNLTSSSKISTKETGVFDEKISIDVNIKSRSKRPLKEKTKPKTKKLLNECSNAEAFDLVEVNLENFSPLPKEEIHISVEKDALPKFSPLILFMQWYSRRMTYFRFQSCILLYRALLFSYLPFELTNLMQKAASSKIDLEGVLQMLLAWINKSFARQTKSCSGFCFFWGVTQRAFCDNKSCNRQVLFEILGVYLDAFGFAHERCFAVGRHFEFSVNFECLPHANAEDALWIMEDGDRSLILKPRKAIASFVKYSRPAFIFAFRKPFLHKRHVEVRIDNALWNIQLPNSLLKKMLVKLPIVFCKATPKATDNKTPDADAKDFADGFPTKKSLYLQPDCPFILEDQIKKMQALRPDALSVGNFKEGQKIFRKSDVAIVKSRECWLRLGRSVRSGEVAAIVRRYTPFVKRLAEADGTSTLPLFAEWQTEEFVPPIAENGIVPRNSFGNVDLYHPRMLPVGCVHLPYADIAKVASELEIDVADAVVGFRFLKGRAAPIVSGVVVCKQNEMRLLQAYGDFVRAERKKRKFAEEEEIRKSAASKAKLGRILQNLNAKYAKPDSNYDSVDLPAAHEPIEEPSFENL